MVLVSTTVCLPVMRSYPQVRYLIKPAQFFFYATLDWGA
jgi:hypothetical protein